jgi:hypothetical protein
VTAMADTELVALVVQWRGDLYGASADDKRATLRSNLTGALAAAQPTSEAVAWAEWNTLSLAGGTVSVQVVAEHADALTDALTAAGLRVDDDTERQITEPDTDPGPVPEVDPWAALVDTSPRAWALRSAAAAPPVDRADTATQAAHAQTALALAAVEILGELRAIREVMVEDSIENDRARRLGLLAKVAELLEVDPADLQGLR